MLHHSEQEDSAENADKRSRVDLDENAQYGQVETHRSDAQSQLEAHLENDPLQNLPPQGPDKESQAQESQEGGSIPATQLHKLQRNIAKRPETVKAARKPEQ